MALPEQQPAIPPDQAVTEIPSVPEIPAHVEQATGVSAVPSTPQPLQGNNTQPAVTPVPAPPSGPSITVPAQSQTQLIQLSKGNIKNSSTWFGVFWLMKIQKALKNGLLVLFGGQK